MPYRIRHGSGKRPFQIVNLQTGKVVGTSESRQSAQGSIAHRMDAEGKNVKKYKRTVDNGMHSYGETDLGKKTVRINKKMSKKNPSRVRPVNKHAHKYPDVLDTIAHEKEHIENPNKTEKNVRKAVLKKVKKMTAKQKQKHYGLFK
jgi:hypothetical protein